jgi:hypothetical protein
MRRKMLIGAVFAALTLALPSAALAHHHGRHHSRHHAHHAAVRLVRFGAAPGAPTMGSPTTPAAPGSATPQPAGKVVSFKEGVLTIALTEGGEVSGKVTEATRLECEGTEGNGGDEDDQGSTSGDHQSISGSRDDMSDGPGSSSGDDQGDEDQGDEDGQMGAPCTTAALVAGATVNEAELGIGSAGAVWEKVELGS